MKARKHTLLIVDDDMDARFFYEKTFESLSTNYKIQLAASGDQAIAYLKGQGQFANRNLFEFPSYILTDLKMSDGDGFHVLEFLKNQPAISVIPVVMISTSDDEDDIRQAYLLGASSYFVKPVTTPELKALLKKIHDYWTECEVPQVDLEGYASATNSTGRLGARYTKPTR
jgi:CheY-like chemotaxis protein